jgi:acetyltransferase
METNEFTSGLDAIFGPKSVAVIGASSTFAKWGQMILSGIVAGGFPGKIFPVNPRDKQMLGLPVYGCIKDIPEPVDLAFIMTPAKTVPGILEQCGEKGVKGVVLITSGFSETDEAGKMLEKDVANICRKRGLTLVGPNTMGIISTYAGLFATAIQCPKRDLWPWFLNPGIWAYSLFTGQSSRG